MSDRESYHTSPEKISITALLGRLQSDAGVTATEIAQAIAYIFTNQLSPVQAGELLKCLHLKGLDLRADILAACALSMRNAAQRVDYDSLAMFIRKKAKVLGTYRGGLCDIVGTGGDSHNTFNVSTTSSILASAILLLGKHGNRASTSKSGSADLLQSTLPTAPNLAAVTPSSLCQIYAESNYAFLFAPNFHSGMKYAAPIRKELGCRTIFNLIGPLTNPVEKLIEARVIGVARKELGPIFAETLKIQGAHKTLVVCGEENLDEISCAGRTHCWKLVNDHLSIPQISSNGPLKTSTTSQDNIRIESFTLQPSDFGLPTHSLKDVFPGKEPKENAEVLMKLLSGQLPDDDPILHFVLMNTSALFVISGVCDTDDAAHDSGLVIQERGPGGGRWKEGVRLARWAIKSGEALKQWASFVRVSNKVCDP